MFDWWRRKGKRYIVQRQSPDWSAITSVEQSVANLEKRLFDPTSDSGREKLEYTKSLLRFWNEHTQIPFWEARGRLKAVAHQTWQKVLGVDGIILEGDFDAKVGEQFESDDVVLFVDDDDWIAPDVFKQLERHVAGSDQGVVWGRVRFDGEWQWLDVTGTELVVYTNNYAVRTGSIANRKLAPAMQHGTLDLAYRQQQWQPELAQIWGVTVTNKSPCSWNYLHQSMMRPDPLAEFQARLHRYVNKASEPLDKRVRWAKDATEAAQSVIRAAMG